MPTPGPWGLAGWRVVVRVEPVDDFAGTLLGAGFLAVVERAAPDPLFERV